MGIGKTMLVVGFYTCGASALLLATVLAPALTRLFLSGREICIPGWSIKCYESDCGSWIVRCGRNALEEIPAGEVCYNGALVPVERTDLHFCLPIDTFPLRNSSKHQALAGCNCALCYGVDKCSCYCLTQGELRVFCTSRYKFYKNINVANCCGDSGCTVRTFWKSALSWSRNVPILLFQGNENLAASFTFHSPPVRQLGSACCLPSKNTACSNVC